MLNLDSQKGFIKSHSDCLSHRKFDSVKTQGRLKEESADEVYSGLLDPFFIDKKIKIIQSKARRRLASKTQVFCLPLNSHIRNRLTHTEEVAGISSIVSNILGLNTFLVEAIAQGHDIGHLPFGHLGEKYISDVTGEKFSHAQWGVVVADKIERNGKGLNLSFETREGMALHSKKELLDNDSILDEYKIVICSDVIGYLFSDLNDGERYSYIDQRHLPDFLSCFGINHRERTATCLFSFIAESIECGRISFSKSEAANKFWIAVEWMYENFYRKIKWELQYKILELIYEYFRKEPFFEGCDPKVLLSLLTDKEASELGIFFLNSRRPNPREDFKDFGFMEILENIRGKNIKISPFV